VTEVVWTAFARQELRNAIAYIAKDNPYAARRVQARIEGCAADLASFPKRGTPGRAADTYELVIAGLPYTIVYECDEAMDVFILRLWHQSRRRKKRH
jgi:toxin ParE1/3/4